MDKAKSFVRSYSLLRVNCSLKTDFSRLCLTSRVTLPVISCSDTYEKFTYYMLQNAIKFLVKKRKDTSVSENSSIFDDHSQTKCVIIPFKGPKNFS